MIVKFPGGVELRYHPNPEYYYLWMEPDEFLDDLSINLDKGQLRISWAEIAFHYTPYANNVTADDASRILKVLDDPAARPVILDCDWGGGFQIVFMHDHVCIRRKLQYSPEFKKYLRWILRRFIGLESRPGDFEVKSIERAGENLLITGPPDIEFCRNSIIWTTNRNYYDSAIISLYPDDRKRIASGRSIVRDTGPVDNLCHRISGTITITPDMLQLKWDDGSINRIFSNDDQYRMIMEFYKQFD